MSQSLFIRTMCDLFVDLPGTIPKLRKDFLAFSLSRRKLGDRPSLRWDSGTGLYSMHLTLPAESVKKWFASRWKSRTHCICVEIKPFITCTYLWLTVSPASYPIRRIYFNEAVRFGAPISTRMTLTSGFWSPLRIALEVSTSSWAEFRIMIWPS